MKYDDCFFCDANGSCSTLRYDVSPRISFCFPSAVFHIPIPLNFSSSNFFQHYFKNCTVESEILKGTFCSFHRRDRHILVSPRKDPPLSKEFVTKILLSTEFSWCPRRPDLVARPLAGPAGRLRGSIGWGGAGTNRKRGIGFGGRVRAAFGRLGQKCFTCFAPVFFFEIAIFLETGPFHIFHLKTKSNVSVFFWYRRHIRQIWPLYLIFFQTWGWKS